MVIKYSPILGNAFITKILKNRNEWIYHCFAFKHERKRNSSKFYILSKKQKHEVGLESDRTFQLLFFYNICITVKLRNDSTNYNKSNGQTFEKKGAGMK